MNHMEEMWDFPVMEGLGFPNANRVHPLIQKRVETLFRHLYWDKNIKKAALFGSSLEFRCSSHSDINLYLEKYDKNRKLKLLPKVECEVDIVTDLSPQSALYREIDTKGLLIVGGSLEG